MMTISGTKIQNPRLIVHIIIIALLYFVMIRSWFVRDIWSSAGYDGESIILVSAGGSFGIIVIPRSIGAEISLFRLFLPRSPTKASVWHTDFTSTRILPEEVTPFNWQIQVEDPVKIVTIGWGYLIIAYALVSIIFAIIRVRRNHLSQRAALQ